jgi:hypothetical protein
MPPHRDFMADNTHGNYCLGYYLSTGRTNESHLLPNAEMSRTGSAERRSQA